MTTRSKQLSIVLIAHIQVTACATPFNLSSPERGIPVPAILKSIKCEMITFLEANRQQRKKFGIAFKAHLPTAYNYPYIDIADDLFAGIYVQLREVDTKSLTVGLDRISRLMNGKSVTFAASPSASETDTFEVNQNFALLQSARIYPYSSTSGSIAEHGPVRENFNCYNNLPPYDEIDFLKVSANEYGANYERIKINSDMTLSQWLRKITVGMSENYLAAVDNAEILAPGQISYSFTLDYKIGIEGRYELIAQIWNPLSAAPSLSTEQSSMFRFIFNTNYAPVSQGADSGAAGVAKAPCIATAKFLDPSCRTAERVTDPLTRRDSRRVLAGATVSPSPDRRTLFDRRNNPEVFYTLPLGIPLSQRRQ